MSGSRSAGQALNFFRRGILLLVNVLVFVLIIFMMFHACKCVMIFVMKFMVRLL